MAALQLTPQTSIRLDLRDAVYIGTFLVATGALYGSFRAQFAAMRAEQAATRQAVQLLDARLWEHMSRPASFRADGSAYPLHTIALRP